MELYKEAISMIGEVWPGARLAAVSPDQIPNRPRPKVKNVWAVGPGNHTQDPQSQQQKPSNSQLKGNKSY